ncbi:MAG: phosphodiester glycosidase family protein, partial [Oscillospiraceae bacterium]|nr:phosphodiester glycosidase family protein [Oscillospiraceae bacterium]
MSKRVISIVLILALVGGTLMVSARGWKTLGSGVEAEENIFYIGDSRENENYFIYSPNSVIRPTVVYGSKLCNYGKFSAMAELLQAKGYSVAGGINAGFFNTPSYQPLGIVVSDGILRSSDEPGYHAIGFRADGSAFIGEPNMTLSIAFNGEYFPLSGYNKARTRTGFTLLSGEYFKDTQNTEPGRDVILVPADRPFDIRVSGSYEFTVVDIIESDAAIALGEGMYTLSLNRSAATSLQTALDGLQRNQTVTLDIRSDPQWLEADSAIGSYIKLVTNGQIDSEYSLAPKADETHPRTAVGIKSDGTVIFYTVDGRQHNISDGLTSLQTAQRMA